MEWAVVVAEEEGNFPQRQSTLLGHFFCLQYPEEEEEEEEGCRLVKVQCDQSPIKYWFSDSAQCQTV